MLLAVVNVQEVIREVVGILRRTIDPRIVIQDHLWPTPPVMADATLLNQVLFNLCLNSRDAMPKGGLLKITTQSAMVDAETPGRPPDSPLGIYTRISVSDTGVGIPEEIRKRMFEPFFTTKAVGQGTGLGLSMVQGIIQQLSGWITCESSPGIGTRFDLFLPAATADTPVGAKNPAQLDTRTPLTLGQSRRMPPAEPDGPTDTGRILLVDDEPMIRTLANAVLSAAGYTVTEAEDGLDAVEIYRERSGDFDLVILDLTMPRMSGRDAFRVLQGINPQVVVLFSSGYSAEDVTDLQNAAGMLSKPYRPDALLSAVRNALQSATLGV
jgi:CheY-like chemotaxis protein